MVNRGRLSAGVAADLAAAGEQDSSEEAPRPDRPELGSNPVGPEQEATRPQVREPSVSPKRRRVDSPSRGPLTRSQTGPVFQKESVRQPLTRVNTVMGGRLPVAQTSLRHGMKDVTIKMATGPHEDQENLPPPNVNRSSMGSLESVCLSDGKEVVNLGDDTVEEPFSLEGQQEESPSPILQQTSPEAHAYRSERPGHGDDQVSSVRSMAPQVDVTANGDTEPTAWEYSFAAPEGGHSIAPTPYRTVTGVGRSEELSRTQSCRGRPISQVPPIIQQHTSAELHRPYSQPQTECVQNYHPPVLSSFGPTVSSSPSTFRGMSGIMLLRGILDQGLLKRLHELQGYRSDTTDGAQQGPFAATRMATLRSGVSSYSYYADILTAIATQLPQHQQQQQQQPQSRVPIGPTYAGTHQQGRVESGHLGYTQAGLASSTWGLPPTGTVTHTDVLASIMNRPPGRARLADLPVSKDMVGIADIAEKLGSIIGRHLPGDAYDYHVYVEAFNKVVESVRKEYLAAASRVSLSASHQALLAFTDNTIVAWREGSILDIFTKCKLLRKQARMELNFRGLIRPSQDTVANVVSRIEALRGVVAGKQALLNKLRQERDTCCDGACTVEDIIEREIQAYKAASADEEPSLKPSYDLLFELGNRWVHMEFITEGERTRGEWEDPGDDFEASNLPTAVTPDLSRDDGATPMRSRRARKSVGSVASIMAMNCGSCEFAS
ncbi:hypothetical protein Pmar_PMAR000125 [Perkinsus marinus ATCC 50983]|uniref:Uncharacterized protein n=1 Tax=Perkinsus marinus (strain ATCC 50983 / TXsc) TaxID=423536 RepID=C5KPZ0_PERM5|nr:hypothetical protein Pmar_PMAR000125 [Perkinsus marinus ATCC 50983]EER13537.1 hypothetical protein Pmar_PMAR000125 [Perkinsus marinus ATCC 50983]|eukprot:XP_002781742.1 hypothetical protein Pmar_PMAR000125 [Perkinsus marinus ATCC 50983]